MDAATVGVIGLVGVVLGAALTALLTRRNKRLSHADELLAQAVNDAIDAIADVAAGTAHDAQARYASAVSRIALHGSPQTGARRRAVYCLHENGAPVDPCCSGRDDCRLWSERAAGAAGWPRKQKKGRAGTTRHPRTSFVLR